MESGAKGTRRLWAFWRRGGTAGGAGEGRKKTRRARWRAEKEAELRRRGSVRRFPKTWQMGLAAGLVAFGLNVWGLCGHAASPAEESFLSLHLGRQGKAPLTDLGWGMMARAMSVLPEGAMKTGMRLSSALFGALGVGLLTGLMTRVGYPHEAYEADTTAGRESVARRISGVATGLFLAVSVPYWWVSTRAIPGTMRVVGLLGIAWLFSWWQHTGRKRALFAWSLAWGMGMAANGGLWATIPLGVALWARELLLWHTGRDWRSHALFFGGVALGLSTAVLWVEWAWRTGAGAEFASRWALAAALFRKQAAVLHMGGGMQPLLVLFACVTGLPWWVLFVASHRSPWFYEREQVMLRVLLAMLLVWILYNGVVAPWRIFGGLPHPMLMPTVLNAVCLGYLAGEFWILGERKLADGGHRIALRWLAGAAACLLPAVELGALGRNADVVLAERDGMRPDVMAYGEREGELFADSDSLEETVALLAIERDAPIQLIRVSPMLKGAKR